MIDVFWVPMCNCHATRQSMSDIPEIDNLAGGLGPLARQILKFSAHTCVDGGSAPQSFTEHPPRGGGEKALWLFGRLRSLPQRQSATPPSPGRPPETPIP